MMCGEKEGRMFNVSFVVINMNTMSFVSRINVCSFKAEEPSAPKSEEETHVQSTEQDKTYSHEVDLKDEEDGDGDLSVNLEYSPTEGTMDVQESTNEPPERKLLENTDLPAIASTSFVDSNQRANITKGEGSQEQPVGDSNLQLNKSSKHNQDLVDEESQEQDPGAPNEEEEEEPGDEEEEEEPEDADAPSDNQEKEKEPLEEQPISKQEGNSDQSDDTLEEFSQPTPISKMQKNGFEQGNQGQEGNSNAEGEDDKTASSKKHIQHTEWQGQERKAGLEATGNQKDMDEKTVSTEPTDDGTIVTRNHEAHDNGGNGDAKHGTSDDYFIPSQEFLEAGKTHSLSYYLKHVEEATDENENVDKSEAGDNQGVRLFTMMLVQ